MVAVNLQDLQSGRRTTIRKVTAELERSEAVVHLTLERQPRPVSLDALLGCECHLPVRSSMANIAARFRNDSRTAIDNSQ